jgi:hypothetical protein
MKNQAQSVIKRIGLVFRFFTGRFTLKPGLGGTQVYRKKRVIKRKEVD